MNEHAGTHLQLVWNFHQPYYSTPNRPIKSLPWVRLHAIRSYYDMARMLERHPQMKCVINFSGALLEQLREYLEVGKRDSWWYLTQKPASGLTDADRQHLLRHFFSLDWNRSVRPLPRYADLLEKRGEDPEAADPRDFSDQEFRDLQVLFNLTWFGFSARRERAVVQALLEKGEGYSEDEKQALLEQQIEVMQLLLPLYRKLQRRGQIEISVTPMYHPILPLVIDTETAGRATPDRSAPPRFQAPEDAWAQIRQARSTAQEVLGLDVDGMWPAEGAVSPEVIDLFDDADLTWTASDESVLKASRGDEWNRDRDLYRPWRLGDRQPAIFFRDGSISDQIGFVYGKEKHSSDAVDDFMRRLTTAGRENADAGPSVVSVILDGETPWGRYPNYGEDFLDKLYAEIGGSDEISSTTPSQYLEARSSADPAVDPSRLETLHSGSWIRGDYSIWIGHDETNRAWELLGDTREALLAQEDDLSASNLEQAWEAIHIAEGSDWYWWYGEDFSSENDADFDRLFRDQLRFVWSILDGDIPAELDVAIMEDRASVVEFDAPKRMIRPRIDGRADYFYEWSGAGVYRNTGAHGSMFENTRYVDEILVGFDLDHLYLRIEPGPDLMGELSGIEFRVSVRGDVEDQRVRVQLDDEVLGTVHNEERSGGIPLELSAFEECLELAIPFDMLGAAPQDRLSLRVSVWDGRMERESHPDHGGLEFDVPDETFDQKNWMV